MSLNEDGQYANAVSAVGARLRDSAVKAGISRADLAGSAGIAKQTFGPYWNGERIPPADVLFRLADLVGVDPRWLISGKQTRTPSSLIEAADADWVNLPKYDLRQMTDEKFGEAAVAIAVRRDWLYANFRTSKDLWLTEMLSEYKPAELSEGALVVCRSISRSDLAEGHVCIWRYDGSILIGQYSAQPDALIAQGRSRDGYPIASATAILGADALNADAGNSIMGFPRPSRNLVIAPSQIGPGDGCYHLVGRILGTFLSPVRLAGS